MDCLEEFDPKHDYTPEQFDMTAAEVKSQYDRGTEHRYERDNFPDGIPDQIAFTWYPIIWISGDDAGYVYSEEEAEQQTNRPVKTRVESRELNSDAHFVAWDMTVNSDGYIYHDGYWVGVLSSIEPVSK